MTKAEKLQQEFNGVPSNREWEWIVAHKDDIRLVELDNDITHIYFKGDKEDEFTISPCEFLGDADGVISLLEALGFNADTV